MSLLKEVYKKQILRLTLMRPESMNALSSELLNELREAIQARPKDTRVVIIDGGETIFCAGLDLKYVTSLSGKERAAFVRVVENCFTTIYNSPIPVIAQIDGPALAGGFDLAIMCDFRIASTRAVFGQPEINIGLTMLIDPLWKIIGLARARELVLTGRTYGPEEALEMGLILSVHDPQQLPGAVQDLAETLASKDPVAVEETKRILRDVPGLSAIDALRSQVDTFVRMVSREGAMEKARKLMGIK